MSPTSGEGVPVESNALPKTLSMNYRKMEKREWWLWSAAVSVTLLLTAGLVSFLLLGLGESEIDRSIFPFLPQVVRSLLGLVLIFNIYTLYQQLQINRIRRNLV